MMREGRVALVTGASSGVGRAIALALAGKGAKVAVTARSADKLDVLVTEIASGGGVAIAIAADLEAPDTMGDLVAQVADRFGTIDHLVNAAGTTGLDSGPDKDQWDVLFNVNARSPYQLVVEALPHFRQNGASVVNIASVFALRASPDAALYSAAKAALVSLTQNLAVDLAPQGIRVNCIAPGAIDTPMLRSAAAAYSSVDPGVILQAAANAHLVRRLVSPEDVAELALFLLSERAEAITGETIALDSGRSRILGAAPNLQDT